MTTRWFLPVVLVAIAGLMLPVYGTALASGYAEMIPGNSHIFVGGASHNTEHLYAIVKPGTDNSNRETGVLALPGGDNSGLIAIVVAVALATLALWAGLTGPLATVFAWQCRQLSLTISIVVPDAPPPRLFPS